MVFVKLRKNSKGEDFCTLSCLAKLIALILLVATLFLFRLFSIEKEIDLASKIKTHEDNHANSLNLNYFDLQSCIDSFISKGSWFGNKWKAPGKSKCHIKDVTDSDMSQILQKFKIGFVGDSTTRSDLRSFEERFECPGTQWFEAERFQKLNSDGTYICDLSEQSINLTKCGIPPIVDVENCHNVSFRYFYKVYPWTPLDKWYMDRPELFQDIDVLVISLGRWFPYAKDRIDVTRDMDTYLGELKQIFTGHIIYQSEYAQRSKSKKESKHPVNCTHGKCIDCWQSEKIQYECEQIITESRPKRDIQIRSIVEQHKILYLDRWSFSKILPMEYYQLWYCDRPFHQQWYCNHHLHFVGLQHLKLLATVLDNVGNSTLE